MENKRKIALSGVIAIAVVAAILLVPSTLAQPPYSADSVYFMPENSTGAYCQNNTIVQINVNTTVATTGVQMDIHFGPCVNITAVDFTGSAWPPLAPPGWAHYGNYVRISGTDLSGQSAGDWKFASITLHCLNGTDYCSSNLNFTNVTIVDNAAIPTPIPNVALHNGTISCTPEIKPNLKVDSVDPQYIFANLTNVLSAVITNNGNNASGPFWVAINITNDCTSTEVPICEEYFPLGLCPGASTTVECDWKPTLNEVENITINVTADSRYNVTDEKDRSDNSKEVVRTTSCACSEYTGTPACANCSADTILPDTCYGYRGQHPLDLAYEGGSGVMYITGDYKYKNDTVNFNIGPGGDKDLISDATADLSSGKTVKSATLYVYYCWYKLAQYGLPDWGMTFNGNPVSHDMNYMDTKGFTMSYNKYAYGTFVYNVTAYVTGNGVYTATRTNTTSGRTSGMALMVIYDDNSSSNMKYKIAHGCDRVASEYISGGHYQYHVLPEDATTTATFLNVDPSMVVTANLFTATVDGLHSSSGVSTNESQKFNDCLWDQGAWSNEGLGTGGSYPIGVDRSDVTACLKNPAQTVYFQERDGSFYNGFSAVFACLQTQEGLPIISVEPEHTIVQPQEQFDIDINVTPNGAPVYAVEYYLHYNSDYFYAETQNKGPFLGNYDQTVVSQNVIDNPNGVLHYAETRTVPGGVINPDTLATIHFTAIGPRGAKSDLNLTGVIIINNATIEPYGAIMVNNGTLEISSNIPPTPLGLSKHQINNVAKKYPCNTIICSCSYDANYPGKGGNITYIRWDFGDGQYGTSEGLPDENNCTCKNHTYDSWQWAPFGDPNGNYVDFNVHLTVTDDGCPEETATGDFPVTVYIAGDANGDGGVDILDAAFVGMHWNECCCASGSCTCYPEPCNSSVSGCRENLWGDMQQDQADLNNDCNINVLDAMITGANWGYTGWA